MAAPPPAASTVLGRELAEEKLGLLFYWPQHEQTVQRAWNLPGNPAALEAVLDDEAAPVLGRVVAAETLFQNDFTFVDRHDEAAIARLYARALRERATRSANVWGLLWINDTVGELGGRFLVLGDSAIPALRELL